MRRSQYAEDAPLATVYATAMVFGEEAAMHMAARTDQPLSYVTGLWRRPVFICSAAK